MALQKPVDPSFKSTNEDFWKTLTVIYCWIHSFLFGLFLVCRLLILFVGIQTWHTDPWTIVSANFVSTLSCLAALYGVKTTRPSWMLPLLVVTATYTGFYVEGTRKSGVAAIENVIFRADESYSFNNNGYWLQLLCNCLNLSACCFLLFTFWCTFKIVRAEKKASESLPVHQAPLHRSFPDDSDKKPILQDV